MHSTYRPPSPLPSPPTPALPPPTHHVPFTLTQTPHPPSSPKPRTHPPSPTPLGEFGAVMDPGNAMRSGSARKLPMGAPPPPPQPRPEHRPVDERAIPGRVYPGKVSNVMDFGCFVQMEGVRGRAEGLVHVSLIQSAMLKSPHDAVKRGQPCYVKVPPL